MCVHTEHKMKSTMGIIVIIVSNIKSYVDTDPHWIVDWNLKQRRPAVSAILQLNRSYENDWIIDDKDEICL